MSTVRQRPLKRVGARALLIVSGIVGALVILELSVRWVDLPPRPLAPLPVADYQLSSNPVIRYEYRPNHQSTDDHWNANYEGFAINSAGFRDYDYAEKKPPGTYRIIILGDSTTAGNGVRDMDRTYAKRLETLLNANGAGGMRYEVLNMGVGGYHTMQEVETLRVKGARYDPDLVLLTFCLNDFALHGDGGVHRKLREKNRGVADAADAELYAGLLRVSRLAFVLHHRLYSSKSVQDRLYTENVLEGQTTVRAGLALLSELQRQYAFSAVVLILPGFTKPFSEYQYATIHERVRGAAEGLTGIAVIDLLDRFARIDDDARKFSHDGLHMNEYGHQTMADILLPIVSAAARDGGRRADPREIAAQRTAADAGNPRH